MSADGLYIGLMSGTSLDGIDAALMAFHDGSVSTVATHYHPYPDDVRTEALALNATVENELHRSAVLANTLARLYATATNALLATNKLAPPQIKAIGCHGQTLRHRPEAGYSLQINSPALLAELTAIDVICDFRSRDIAAGGQGAPLVPAVHDALFRTPTEHRVILNLGGIANLTQLKPGAPALGFDCGPANMLLDAWIQHCQGKAYDADGSWARTGKVIPTLLQRLLENSFLQLAPPKSCGREQFNLPMLLAELKGDESPADVQATLAEFTVRSSADAIKRWCGIPDAVYLCGGGARNIALTEGLRTALPTARIESTDSLGVAADWVEAVAFAWLAFQHVARQPGNRPEVTGARGPRILGACYPA